MVGDGKEERAFLGIIFQATSAIISTTPRHFISVFKTPLRPITPNKPRAKPPKPKSPAISKFADRVLSSGIVSGLIVDKTSLITKQVYG